MLITKFSQLSDWPSYFPEKTSGGDLLAQNYLFNFDCSFVSISFVLMWWKPNTHLSQSGPWLCSNNVRDFNQKATNLDVLHRKRTSSPLGSLEYQSLCCTRN